MSKNKKKSNEKRMKALNNSTVQNLLYTDSHFHYTGMLEASAKIKSDREAINDPWMEEEAISNLMNSENFQGMDIGTNFDDLPNRYNLLKNHSRIHLSAGIGPWGADREESVDFQINKFKENIERYPISAIGEIGLDYYWNYGTPEKQEELLLRQIEISEDMHLPIIIHTRDADDATIKILKERTFKYGGIIHCFSGSRELCDVALSRGFLISFAGPITYKKNEELREILKTVPQSSLLLETDSPHLPPEPFRGKYNTPTLIPLVYERASEINKVSIQELSKTVSKNFSDLLGNPKRLD